VEEKKPQCQCGKGGKNDPSTAMCGAKTECCDQDEDPNAVGRQSEDSDPDPYAECPFDG